MSAPASRSLRAHSPGVSPSYETRDRLLERHRHHDREPGRLGALDEQERLAEVGEGLADPEVGRPGVELVLELPIEELADVVRARGVLRQVRPGEREVAGDQRVALRGDLPSDTDGRAVDLVHLAGQPHRRELVVARVEGHRLQHLGTRAQELAVELREGVRMLDHHLGRERARLDVAALLELEQVAAVAEDGAIGESFEDASWHGWNLLVDVREPQPRASRARRPRRAPRSSACPPPRTRRCARAGT